MTGLISVLSIGMHLINGEFIRTIGFICHYLLDPIPPSQINFHNLDKGLSNDKGSQLPMVLGNDGNNRW